MGIEALQQLIVFRQTRLSTQLPTIRPLCIPLLAKHPFLSYSEIKLQGALVLVKKTTAFRAFPGQIGKRGSFHHHQFKRGPNKPCAWWDRWFGGAGSNGNKRDSYDSEWESDGEDDEEESNSDDESDKSYRKKQFVSGLSPYWSELTPYQRLKVIGGDVEDVDAMLENEKDFENWMIRNRIRMDMAEASETGADAYRVGHWEDWLDSTQKAGAKVDLGDWYQPQPEWEKDGMPRKPPKLPERGMSRTFKELLFLLFQRDEEVEDQLTFEDRVFRYTSRATGKFVAFLIAFPCFTGYLLHDFVLVPFIDVWCERAPVVEKMLDVTEKQKIEMVNSLRVERNRAILYAEIGRTPPLSDEEMVEFMHETAVDLRKEIRAENRSAFANIWTDFVIWIMGFLICVFNPRQVSIMRMTGQRIFTNISDTGKAFIIILCTDIFLGYHSEKGWETLIEIVLEHYHIEASINQIYIFVATVPVTLDVCFKLWVFKYLTRSSPSCAATLKEMHRH